MTQFDAMDFIDKTYIKWIDSKNSLDLYIDDVISILNKMTNSNSYEIARINSGGLSILKDKIKIYDKIQGTDVISHVDILNKEIILFKLDLLNKEYK